jgi:dienelactone hydrolase
MMQKQTVEYYDGDVKLTGQLVYDDNIKAPRAGIVVFHAFEGRGEFALEYCEWLAQDGYVAFAADMFGEAQVADTLDECMEFISPFFEDRNLARRRAKLAYETLQSREVVKTNNIGGIGFCFGGMCALELARSGSNVQAIVSAHGLLKKSELPTESIQSKIFVLHGYKDPQVPPDMLEGFAQEMDEAGVADWTFTFFGNAQHAFTDPRTGSFDADKEKEIGRVYDETAAKRTYRYALDFFKETLTP